MRTNVAKVLPVLRRQIKEMGYDPIRKCLVKGKTRGMNRKDRYEAMLILDRENNHHG